MSIQEQEKIYQTLLGPHVSEKATILADDNNCITFKVEKKATKKDIKKSVEFLVKTQVLYDQKSNFRGNVKLNKFGKSRKSSWKKAYVKLAPGQDIDFTQID